MKICGIKPTHDAAVALIDGDELVFSVELEKIGNAPRYTKMPSMKCVEEILDAFGCSLGSVDTFVFDGWRDGVATSPAGTFSVAPYHEFNALVPFSPTKRFLSGPADDYVSYTHMAGHIFGSYALSPFSADKSPVYVLSFDGRQNPRLHRLAPRDNNCLKFVASLFPFSGFLYAIQGYYFGPFFDERVAERKPDDQGSFDPHFGQYEWPGKIMALIAKGTVNRTLLNHCWAYLHHLPVNLSLDIAKDAGRLEHEFCRSVAEVADKQDVSDLDVLATVHHFLSAALVDCCISNTEPGMPLIFTGGSALNIKWNSALRSCGHFSDVFVMPAPNDAGSALGQAAAHAALAHDVWSLRWSQYAGPHLLRSSTMRDGWGSHPTTPSELGRFLAKRETTPVVVLHGRAEIGPRALGHRSIFMAATFAGNKDVLNEAKGRESYRPVAPICLEEYAADVFDPGTSDPFMLFEHRVRKDWVQRVPAILHLDGSARLQTISERECRDTTAILRAYHEATGVPLLCNTSANWNGKGFFPDVISAMEWCEQTGFVHRIWSDGRMYFQRREK